MWGIPVLSYFYVHKVINSRNCQTALLTDMGLLDCYSLVQELVAHGEHSYCHEAFISNTVIIICDNSNDWSLGLLSVAPSQPQQRV
jgi:hypothetical protein